MPATDSCGYMPLQLPEEERSHDGKHNYATVEENEACDLKDILRFHRVFNLLYQQGCTLLP